MTHDQPVPLPETKGLEAVEEQSFEEFYLAEYAAVLMLARVLTGNRAWAEDVTHDAFAAALKAWGDLTNPPGWVRRVVANQANSGWRRVYAERRALKRLESEANSSELPVETEDFWGEVRRLSRRQAQTLALYYLEDRPVSEIAEILGCAESTARVHLMRRSFGMELRHGVRTLG